MARTDDVRLVQARQARQALVRFGVECTGAAGMARWLKDGPGSAGLALLGADWSAMVAHGRLGIVRYVGTRQGMQRQDRQGPDRRVWCGTYRQGRPGRASQGPVRSGFDRRGRHEWARLDWDRFGRLGRSRRGSARNGRAWIGRHGKINTQEICDGSEGR